ncbi:MAG TPA: IS200/IS605 family transposase [Planctomycetota bacterium]|nr:IS200/IS605 family transposase [Planctomycetota bacterium]
MSYTQIFYHVVFATKDRTPALIQDGRPDLFSYCAGILRNCHSEILAINGVEDHLHLLISLHPTVALADLVKNLKLASGQWLRRDNRFPHFRYWQDNYAAFTVSVRERAAVIQYIRGQEAHHKHVSFREELIEMLKRAQIRYDERYLP